jgi:ABC-type transport system involved in cytochrome c biogenesis permease subunit
MGWTSFGTFYFISTGLWFLAILLFYLTSKKPVLKSLAHILTVLGIISVVLFTIQLWIFLERPPLRTKGETRLWYSLFLSIIGYLGFLRWRYKWFLAYSLSLSVLFLFLNYLHPETYSKTLMPALQSIWFIPHVIVYMFAYALLGASALVSIKGLYQLYFKKEQQEVLRLADNLVYTGFAFLTLGLVFGGLWAKEAWGHYWTWDPKETWALLTWLIYLLYMHYRKHRPEKILTPVWMLALAFIILFIAWFGINYLPSAAESVHTYQE